MYFDLRCSFFVNKYVFNLGFFLELPIIMGLPSKVLSPGLGTFRVTAGKFDDSFNLVNFFTHACMQLYFHCV